MCALYVYVCIYRYVYPSCSFSVVDPQKKRQDCKIKSKSLTVRSRVQLGRTKHIHITQRTAVTTLHLSAANFVVF